PWIISNACASGSNAVGHAAMLIGTGQAKRAICGGYDAISRLVFAGFDCLRAATPDKCRPFDRNRTGLVLGEGAAILILEEWETAERGSAEILAEIAGYGAANDNHHLTQPDPSGAGPRRSMQAALAVAGQETVDYVNAHGTGTPHNDASEGAAIGQLLPGVPVSSTKGAMGHSLGAAGAIEAVFCILALRGQFLPPNLNFTTPDEAIPVNVAANPARPAALRSALSNSFGFGGSNASLVFRTA
ncbi:MAG TPA: beta-ketoacyl-[acyl-carrier-protein] synthase family protein, partial [Chthoniobacterales bacterium]